MPRPVGALVDLVRREVLSWLFAGLALHAIWLHGLDQWSVTLAVGAMMIHPGRSDGVDGEI